MKIPRPVAFASGIIVACASLLVPHVPFLSSAPPVFAAGTCSTDRNSHTGYESLLHGGYGSRAWIVSRIPSLCSGGTPTGGDSISAWSMILDTNGINYAQSGYTQNGGQGSTYYFSEYSDSGCSGGACTRYFGATTDGNNNQFWETYDQGDHSIYMFIDGSIVQATPYDPTNSGGANYWPGPWSQQYLGENYNVQDDMPGTSGEKATFTSVAYSPTPSNFNGNVQDNWQPIVNPQLAKVTTYWCVDGFNNNAFNIWTQGTCPSGT